MAELNWAGHFTFTLRLINDNFQDASLSYDPETPPGDTQSGVVFREGQTLGGHVTHTPRLIAMDLKGNRLH